MKVEQQRKLLTGYRDVHLTVGKWTMRWPNVKTTFCQSPSDADSMI